METRNNSVLVDKDGKPIGVKNRKLDNADSNSNNFARAHMSVPPREMSAGDESQSHYDGCRSMRTGELSEMSGDGDFP